MDSWQVKESRIGQSRCPDRYSDAPENQTVLGVVCIFDKIDVTVFGQEQPEQTMHSDDIGMESHFTPTKP